MSRCRDKGARARLARATATLFPQLIHFFALTAYGDWQTYRFGQVWTLRELPTELCPHAFPEGLYTTTKYFVHRTTCTQQLSHGSLEFPCAPKDIASTKVTGLLVSLVGQCSGNPLAMNLRKRLAQYETLLPSLPLEPAGLRMQILIQLLLFHYQLQIEPILKSCLPSQASQ